MCLEIPLLLTTKEKLANVVYPINSYIFQTQNFKNSSVSFLTNHPKMQQNSILPPCYQNCAFVPQIYIATNSSLATQDQLPELIYSTNQKQCNNEGGGCLSFACICAHNTPLMREAHKRKSPLHNLYCTFLVFLHKMLGFLE